MPPCNLRHITVHKPDVAHGNILNEVQIGTIAHPLARHALPVSHIALRKTRHCCGYICGAFLKLRFVHICAVRRKQKVKYYAYDGGKKQKGCPKIKSESKPDPISHESTSNL